MDKEENIKYYILISTTKRRRPGYTPACMPGYMPLTVDWYDRHAWERESYHFLLLINLALWVKIDTCYP